MTVAGTWNIALYHNIFGTSNLINVSIILNTFSNYECINFCSGKSNSLGLAPGTTNICVCAIGYIWNSTTNNCIIDCSKIQYANGINLSNFSACLCLTNFWFNN